MTVIEQTKGIVIHIVVPLGGVAFFLGFCFRMRKASIPSPPFGPWFIIFFSVGGWLLIALTVLFWKWSGLASIGFVFLVFVAPWITAGAAWRLRGRRLISSFHRCAFLGGVAYSGLMLLLALVWTGYLVGRR